LAQVRLGAPSFIDSGSRGHVLAAGPAEPAKATKTKKKVSDKGGWQTLEMTRRTLS